jgi:hypothetical protein
MAQAICCIVSAKPEWKENYMADVLDELFMTPEAWNGDNVAGFLLFCSERVSE